MLLRAFLAQRKSLILLLLALGLTVGSLEGAFILLAKSALVGNDLHRGWIAMLVGMGLLVTTRTAIQIMATHFELRAVFAFLAEKRQALLDLSAKHAVPLYRSPCREDLASAYNHGLENLGQGIGAGFRCLASLAQALVLVPMLFLFSWKLALAALLLAFPALLASRLRANMLASSGKGWERSQAELAKTVEEFSEGTEAHIGNGRIREATANLDGGLVRHAERTRTWEAAKAIFPPALEWFFFIALAVLAGLAATYGGIGDGGHGITGPASLLPFGALLLLIYRPIREWARHYPSSLLGGQAWLSLRNLEATMAIYPARKPFAWRADGAGGEIRLARIRFGYVDGPLEVPSRWVFENYDLNMDPAEVTWISGRNGSGKTTLLKLLAGVETSQAGEILLPSSLRAWPRPIGYLSQKAVVEPDWLEWSQGFRAAHPEDWGALDNILGFERILSRSGSLQGLSGGERQRLCLARAFAAPCGYLLLDEPTTWLSAEDRESIMGDLIAFWRSPSLASGPVRLRSRGIAMVSHEPFLGEFCSRTVRLERGQDQAAVDSNAPARGFNNNSEAAA